VSTLIVLGAGASRAAFDAMPLGAELVWEFPSVAPRWATYHMGVWDTSEEGERLRLYRRFLRVAEVYCEDLQGLVDAFDAAIQDNVAFSVPVELRKRHYVDDLLGRMQDRKDSVSIELVRELIAEHLFDVCSNVPGKHAYYRLTERLASLRNEVVIVSYNFDTLLRSEPTLGVHYDYGAHFDYVDPHLGQQSEHSPRILLLKPHGSLDWAECVQCGLTMRLFPHQEFDTYRKLTCPSCHGKTKPIIEMPSETPSQLLRPVVDQTRTAIEQAEHLIVIGYSFPEYDLATREMFASAIRDGAGLTVVDVPQPGQSPTSTCSRLRGKCLATFEQVGDVIVRLDGFEGFLESPPPEF